MDDEVGWLKVNGKSKTMVQSDKKGGTGSSPLLLFSLSLNHRAADDNFGRKYQIYFVESFISNL